MQNANEDREERATAFSLWKYSEAYLKAAKHVVEAKQGLKFSAPKIVE